MIRALFVCVAMAHLFKLDSRRAPILTLVPESAPGLNREGLLQILYQYVNKNREPAIGRSSRIFSH